MDQASIRPAEFEREQRPGADECGLYVHNHQGILSASDFKNSISFWMGSANMGVWERIIITPITVRSSGKRYRVPKLFMRARLGSFGSYRTLTGPLLSIRMVLYTFSWNWIVFPSGPVNSTISACPPL